MGRDIGSRHKVRHHEGRELSHGAILTFKKFLIHGEEEIQCKLQGRPAKVLAFDCFQSKFNLH